MRWAVSERLSLSRAMRGMKAASESKSASGFDLTRVTSMLQSDDTSWIWRTRSIDLR